MRGQHDLVISEDESSCVQVDNLEMAQFIYLIVNNKKLRDIIDSIASKAVLILGRLEPKKRKVILDALKDSLTINGYVR